MAVVKSFEYKIAISANFVQTVKNSTVRFFGPHLFKASRYIGKFTYNYSGRSRIFSRKVSNSDIWVKLQLGAKTELETLYGN